MALSSVPASLLFAGMTSWKKGQGLVVGYLCPVETALKGIDADIDLDIDADICMLIKESTNISNKGWTT